MYAKHYLQQAKKLVHIGLIFSWVAGYTSGNKAKPLEIQYKKTYIPIFVCAKYHKFILCLSISTDIFIFFGLSSGDGSALDNVRAGRA